MKQQLKKFVLADVEKFEEVGGKKIYPSGDYSDIKEFPSNSIFGAYSRFGDNCTFGNYIDFGRHCEFGLNNTFGNHINFAFGCIIRDKAHLGEGCNIGAICQIGDNSKIGQFARIGTGCFIGDYCIFETGCVFADSLNKIGDFCSFGDFCCFAKQTIFPTGTYLGSMCNFGEGCEFAEGCQTENGHEFTNMFFVGQVGRRKETIYFWQLADGRILVRCKEIIGTLAEFMLKIRESRWDDKNAQDYILAANYAISRLTCSCNYYDSVWIN